MWERYLGSALPPGSYTVSVHLRRGPLLAQRSFEVLPEDLSAIDMATRLRLLPQYFDLVNESEHAGGLGASTVQMPEASMVSTTSTTSTKRTKSAKTTKTTMPDTSTTTRVPKMQQEELETAPSQPPAPSRAPPNARPRPLQPSHDRAKPPGSLFRPGTKDREWLQKDGALSRKRCSRRISRAALKGQEVTPHRSPVGCPWMFVGCCCSNPVQDVEAAVRRIRATPVSTKPRPPAGFSFRTVLGDGG